MFEVSNVNVHFGARHILRDATFRVEDGERAAIVGPNGAGKSTLLKVIAGQITPETGGISKPKESEIGYLPQELTLDSPLTVEQECRTVFQELLEHEKEMRDIEHRMAEMTDFEGDEYARMAERYDFLIHETMRRDASTMDSQIGKVLSGLGFKAEDLRRPVREFSGGWQMRIALGKLLLRNPDILLLDEPTNHLDIETIEWLGDWLANHEGSILMVSHERAFMDKVINKVVSIDRGRARLFRGNYSISLQKRDEEREHQRRAFENQQLEIAHVEKFISRFRYQASKAALVQSRVKQLERLERIEEPESELSTINFRFPEAPRSAKEVIKSEHLTKAFGRKTVFRDVNLTVYRGEKVALVGVNGAGKSTLMKCLAGKLQQDEGTITLGGNVAMEYFAQYDYEDLHMSNTVYTEFVANAPLSVSEKARGILGAFLFSGEDVDKPIRVLSGGEKTRLRLAKMLCGKSNLLLLDEPTNHLDIGSRMTLETALQQYEGAVLLVSHDRYFLDKVATRVVEIRDGELRSYQGNYEDYLRMKAVREGAEVSQAAAPRPSAAPASPIGSPNGSAVSKAATLSSEDKKAQRGQRQELSKELSKVQKAAAQLEDRVQALDAEQRRFENEMARPDVATNPQKLADLTRKLEALKAEMARTEEEWMAAQVKAEELADAVAALD